LHNDFELKLNLLQGFEILTDGHCKMYLC